MIAPKTSLKIAIITWPVIKEICRCRCNVRCRNVVVSNVRCDVVVL